MRNNFTFFDSFYDAINDLNDCDQLKLYKAICGYALRDIEPELTGLPNTIFKVIKPVIDRSNKRRDDGEKYGVLGGRPKKKDNTLKIEKGSVSETENPTEKGSVFKIENPTENQNININTNKNKKVNVNENEIYIATSSEVASAGAPKAIKRFKPPTKEELDEYCIHHDLSIDTERFLDYYTSNGWSVGRNKMKDWKAAARNWARNQNMRASPSPQKEDCGNVFLQLAKEEGLIQ